MIPTFEACLAHTGLDICQDLSGYYRDYCASAPGPGPLLDREFLVAQARRFGLGHGQLQRMLTALDEIEADPVLLRFSQFLVSDMCAARHRCDLDDYQAMVPVCMHERDLYSFLLLMACVQPSIKRLEEAGVPEYFYREIPFTPMARQFEKLEKTGDGQVEDFPWDMNFYTCSIFFLDRFYFIPFRMDDPICVFRSKTDGRTVAFLAEKTLVRRDGQLDGVNGIFDDQAYTADFSVENGKIRGVPISPAGLMETSPIELDQSDWELVLQQGDILLGTHIPDGPGYQPQRLRSSIQWAADFFDRYFPEIPFKGFGSESWLYDPHLRLLLPSQSNIVRMQDQMYIYPIMSGSDMIFRELFLGEDHPTEKDCHTSLQRNALDRLRSGGQFTASSMFILRQDAAAVGSMPYGCAAQREEACRRLAAYDEPNKQERGA